MCFINAPLYMEGSCDSGNDAHGRLILMEHSKGATPLLFPVDADGLYCNNNLYILTTMVIVLLTVVIASRSYRLIRWWMCWCIWFPSYLRLFFCCHQAQVVHQTHPLSITLSLSKCLSFCETMCVYACVCWFLVVEYGERGKESGLLTVVVYEEETRRFINQLFHIQSFTHINNNEEVKCNWTLTGQQRNEEDGGN